MTQSHIRFRPIRPSDYATLEDIIRKTWDYDRLGSPKLAKQMAKVYLASCLANQTYTNVAVVNSEPVGIIMGKNKATHRRPLKYAIRESLAIAQIAISKEGRKVGKMFEKIDQMDDVLYKQVQTKFDCELAFFVVDGGQRGSGIGNKLYQQFLSYMASEDLKSFYLFTDTTCNYAFYEHQGLTRLAEEALDIPRLQNKMRFFIYGNR